MRKLKFQISFDYLYLLKQLYNLHKTTSKPHNCINFLSADNPDIYMLIRSFNTPDNTIQSLCLEICLTLNSCTNVYQQTL